MGYMIEFNRILKIRPDSGIDVEHLKKGTTYTISKKGEHFYPLHKALEYINERFDHLGKAEITKLTLEKDKTTLTFKVLKVFSKTEKDIFTKNFIGEEKFKK